MESVILKRLGEFHRQRGDLFYGGVKNGSTYMKRRGELKIIDGLAIKPSWVSQMVTGYEVKSSKGDFRQDEKWHHYISEKMCHRLYIATPPGIVKAGELPDGIGLVEIDGKGGLRWVKRASTLNTEINKDIYQFIVFSRMPSEECPIHRRQQSIDHHREWFKAKMEGREVGGYITSYLNRRIKPEPRPEENIVPADKDTLARAQAFKALCHDCGLYIGRDVKAELLIIRRVLQKKINLNAMKEELAKVHNHIGRSLQLMKENEEREANESGDLYRSVFARVSGGGEAEMGESEESVERAQE